MATYRYQNGDRPLDGYVIEQALGRGGFGEVYYAVSDSGRQVALKAVQNYEDIELRGISHCMNLKSPHLVTIFDVKHSQRGDPFVIMEYVLGPSLRDLLDEAPHGLGPEKAAWFIREMARGLALLHDNGIVHRDLKPHNVFFEDGYVKVGDYSLSKVITASHRSGHTLTVGTVHYMAPEIGLGRYDRTVDIYALGVLLYEMLTGQPPFTGETMGEVLMKHMAGDVDISALDEPYASVVLKAMAREPEQRYQSVDEMVADLFGHTAVVESVSTFSPNSLTAVARKAVTPVLSPPVNVADGREIQQGSRPKAGSQAATATRDLQASTPYHLGRLCSRLGAAFCFSSARYGDSRSRSKDPIPWQHRAILGLLVVLVMAWVSNGITPGGEISLGEFEDEDLYGQAVLMAGVALAAVVAQKFMPGGHTGLPGLFCRIFTAGSALGVSLVVSETLRPFSDFEETAFCVIVPLIVMDWQWLTAPVRPQRIRLTPCLGAAVIALLICAMTEGLPLTAAAIIGSAALAAQTIAAFDPVGSRKVARATGWIASARDALGAWYGVRFPDIVAELRALDGQPPGGSSGPEASDHGPMANPAAHAPTMARGDSAEVEAAGHSWPQSSTAGRDAPELSAGGDIPQEGLSRVAGLVLCLLPVISFGFLPLCGLHRLATGRIASGLLWLFTLGLAGIGQLVDLILTALGEFRDAAGRPLRSRATNEVVNGLSSVPAETLVSNGMTVLGGLLTSASILLGAALAIDVPAMIAADLFREMDLSARDLESMMGTKIWPELLREVLQLLVGVTAVLAVGLLVASRRSAGMLHVLRVPLSVIPMGLAIGLLMEACSRISWSQVDTGIQQGRVGLVMEVFLGGSGVVPYVVAATAAFTVAMLILSIPPRQRMRTPEPQPVPTRQEA